MTNHTTGTREEWLVARLELLKAEKELTRRSDELTRRRQELPWVRIDKEYSFDTDRGKASLADLFRGRSQLLVYHFMFGPDYTAGCPNCSAIADGFNGSVVHLANHDVMLWAVSRAPLARLQAYKRRMGWSFPWASTLSSDFNYDFHVSFTEQQQRSGNMEYNYRKNGVSSRKDELAESEGVSEAVTTLAASVGTDSATYVREHPGMSAFPSRTASFTTLTRPTRAGWTCSGPRTNGSTERPEGVTRPGPGSADATSTMASPNRKARPRTVAREHPADL